MLPSSSMSSTLQLSGVRVLVIDDHPDRLDIEQEILDWAGADVVVARSRREASAAWKTGPFDVVVGDLSRADRTAGALVGRLRAAGDHTPALALSGAPEIDEACARGLGFDRFLEKPIASEVLVDTVRDLARAGAEARARRAPPPSSGP